MHAPIELRLLEGHLPQHREPTADWRFELHPKRQPLLRPMARQVGLALIRLGERLAEPAPGPRPARAR